MTALRPGISVVVPAYNSESTLPLLFGRLRAVLPQAAPEYEVIVVNDGSRDGTWAVIEAQAAQDSRLQPINLMRNYGQHNALLCGIRAARYTICVTIDDDLQHPPEEIGKLLAELSKGSDVAYGTPQAEQHGVWRNLASRVTKVALQSAMGADVARKVSAFRAFRTEVRDAFADFHGAFLSVDVLLTWGTTRFSATPVRHDPRTIGTSNYTFRKLLVHAMNMVTGFSTVPLQIASLLGFAFTLLGLLLFIYVVAVYVVQGRSVPGFPFLASVITIFSGAQLFALGIIGEYLARVHSRTMDKPSYVIRHEQDLAVL
jgi:glycosyltransferase involved in cell wall biosynthesis